jgi:hypothetical protein
LLVQFAHSLLHLNELDLQLKAPFQQFREFGLWVFRYDRRVERIHTEVSDDCEPMDVRAGERILTPLAFPGRAGAALDAPRG